jgi:hypothetical protein
MERRKDGQHWSETYQRPGCNGAYFHPECSTSSNKAVTEPDPDFSRHRRHGHAHRAIQRLPAGAPQSNPPPPQSQLANGVAPVTLAQAPDSSQRSDPPPQSQTPNQPPLVQLTASALPAAATATGSSNNAASSASQQQLANLEAMLQQLGIDPQSLSGPALSALVHDAASPAALLAYVKELQGTSPPAAPSADHINVTA